MIDLLGQKDKRVFAWKNKPKAKQLGMIIAVSQLVKGNAWINRGRHPFRIVVCDNTAIAQL